MNTKDDGGPAFPRPHSSCVQCDACVESQQGLSLRDYFAAQALPEAIRNECDIRAAMINPQGFRYDEVAKAAYVIADAMLAERAK